MSIVKRILPYLKPVWKRFATALLCMALVASISTGVIWVMKFLFDHALADQDLDALYSGVALILGGFALKAMLQYTHTYFVAYASQTAARQLRDDAYRHLYSLSMGFFNEKASGGLLSRLTNDITILQAALMSGPTVVVRDGLTIIGLIGFLLFQNLKFAALCFMILPLAGWVLTRLGMKSRKAGREGQAKMAGMYSTIQEGLAAMPIVKVFQNEDKEISDFSKENRNYFETMMKLARIEARSSPIMECMGAVVLAFMLMVGGRDVIAGDWSLGSFVAFVGAAMSLYNPIKKFANVNVALQQGLAAAERVFELLDQESSVADEPNAPPAPMLANNIEFKNVSFRYPRSNMVLEQVNLTVKKGEVVALVGPSGSGKTTLALLLLRFYDPIAGNVSIDGRDLASVSTASLRKQMAVVTQETHLFNDSVRANIAYGKPDASFDEIVEAAKAAYAHDFISSLPQGYDTIIGERGARLSGGEKQRIAIARSLVKNPAILILDEATSALDTASEQAVQMALDHLLEGRTVLMIAHRLSTVRKANRIVVLEGGRIQEIGSHDELLQRKGTYHKLYELQAIA